MTAALLALLLQAPGFNREIRPLLADNCFACHGPDQHKRKADLRLDVRPEKADVLAEIVRRITHEDPEEHMPPPKSGKKLDADQIALLRRWIDAGAPYEKHWAFLPPTRPPLPAVRDAAWSRNEIDRFVLARLEHEGLRPSPPAPLEILIRRVSLDLTGLPPTPAEVDAFLADRDYEKLVDRLLDSPRYGERMALDWLDAARFADTHGLHVDSHRDMWPWRDWVIAAFNRNLPFDRFTLDQLAGDLLPEPTRDQLVATGFNRNHLISYQGSAIVEQIRNGYIIDRTNTTATVWLGLTMGCAQCHDHKFDPVTQREYYGLYAFFNTIDEKAIDGRDGNAEPLVRFPSPEQDAALAELRDRMIRIEADEKAHKALRDEEKKLLAKISSSMVMREAAKPRETFLLERGEYNRPGEKVLPGTPAVLPPMADDLPRNRLGLARWLLDPAHPLTARVEVNRLWQMLFGTGLVETAEDFGARGGLPSHPELLDWMAVEFAARWDVKATLRRIVTSATYRQASVVSAHDPSNRLLGRGPRVRLPAELVRDNALAIGGLLVEKIGGPSVRPYQPAGVWEAVAAQDGNYTAQKYEQDHGDALYRRSLYTFWKRNAPPPAMMAFDAPIRDVCTVRRQRTNSPLQALVLMNDPTFIEAARGLAALAMAAPDPAALAFRRATARLPTREEADVLRDTFRLQRERFARDPEAAKKLLSVGESKLEPGLDPVDYAAWTAVCSVILNLDETITKP